MGGFAPQTPHARRVAGEQASKLSRSPPWSVSCPCQPSTPRVASLPRLGVDCFQVQASGLGARASLGAYRPRSGQRPRPSTIVDSARFWSVLGAVKGEPKARCERTNP
jgi:hypothetical protein